MDWSEILQQIFQLCLIPFLGIIADVACKAVKLWGEKLLQKADSEREQKYISMLTETVNKCVIATNQTYVEALKEVDAFDEEAQKEALTRTYEAVLAILSEDAKEYLESVYGDLSTYVSTMIEAEVAYNK